MSDEERVRVRDELIELLTEQLRREREENMVLRKRLEEAKR